MAYRTKLFLANGIPIVVFAIVALLFGHAQFESSLYSEREGHLKSTALAALSLYSGRGYGDYGLKADGDIWRGMNFNVSEETELVDSIKRQTGVDITFFFGDTAVMTSLENHRSGRVADTSAMDYIREHVLGHGSQLWCQNITINGKTCQAYVIPIRQESDQQVVGAMMASQSVEGFNQVMRRYILTMTLTTLVILYGVFLFIRWHVGQFSQEFSEVADKSKQDLLTGLYNKVTFEEEVQKAIAKKKPGEVAILMIFDFDNFKHINDSYGHQIGDEVLKAFAHVLGRAFRTKDIIGRIGGDEFMVYMPDMAASTIEHADEISQEILAELAALEIGPAKHFSASIGIGTDGGNYDFKGLYLLADTALYESKKRGKACYVRCSSEGGIQ